MEDRRFVAELIDIFRYYPCLWDPRCPQFGDESKRLVALNDVINKLKTADPECASVYQACARYRELRDHSFADYHIYDTVLKYFTAIDGSSSNTVQDCCERSDDDVYEDYGAEVYASAEDTAYAQTKVVSAILSNAVIKMWDAVAAKKYNIKNGPELSDA